MSGKTLAIFDVDGTLVYSESRDSKCFANVYQEIYGKPFPTLDWRNYPHVTDYTIFSTVIQQHFQREPEAGEFDHFIEQFCARIIEKREADPRHSNPIPNAPQLIEHLLDDSRYEVAIATGGWERPARIKLEHVRIPHQSIFMSCADGQPTRNDIINKVFDQGIQHPLPHYDRVVYIGDAIWDVETTRNMNLNFVGVRWRGDYEVLKREGASHVVKNYEEVDYFLECLAEARPPA